MNKIHASILSVVAVSAIAGATLVPTAVNAWGDSGNGRKTYTLAEINNGNLGNTITFNSITNGKIGDERNFVGAKLTSSTENLWNADTISVKDGETYTIRLYVHNNSPLGKNAIATGVSTSFSLPTTISNSHTIVGYINSSNATPSRYWDEVTLTSTEDFYLEYVNGSAKWTSMALGTVALSDSVVTSGATVGYDALNGQIPGCYDYDGQVTIQVKVHTSKVNSKLSKTVRLKGDDTWHEAIDAKVGDQVEFQIEYVNLSADSAKNVMIRDILPTNMEYVSGSTYLYNAYYQNGTKLDNDTVTTTGINIGNYGANGNAYVQFTAKVVNKTLVCGNNQLVNWASSTVNSVVSKDDASVYVKQEKDCKAKDNSGKGDNAVDQNTSRIVDTGATEVLGGALGLGSVVTAGGYFVASRRKF